jgi:hypothetical protein
LEEKLRDTLRKVKYTTAILAITATFLVGCASFQHGDKTVESELKKFAPVAGKTSLYVCRESALLVARGVSTRVIVDNDDIGTVKANTFVHTVLEPGKHGVLMRNDGLASGTGGLMTIETKPDEVAFLWVGVTGKGFGTLTVDYFDSKQDAMNCVTEATYAVKAQPASQVSAAQ